MATLRQVGERWQIRFQDRKRTPKEVSFTFSATNFGAREIKALKKELEVQQERGEWDPWTGRLPAAGKEDAAITIREAVDRYSEVKRTMGQRRQRGGWSEKTHADYVLRLRAFAREAGERRQAATLTTEDLARHIHAKAVAEETQQNRRRMLGTFVRWLKKEGYAAPEMPPPIVATETLGTYCTEEELEAICRAHEQLLAARQARKHAPKTGPSAPSARRWMTAAWRFAFYQALRRGELLAMRVGGVDARRGLMAIGDKTFIPKDRKEHVVALTPPAAAVIAPVVAGRRPEERVWPVRAAKQITNAFKAAVVAAVESGELPADKAALHLHNLRDSGCMYWLRKGVDLRHVRDLLRHKGFSVTLKHYYHVEVEQQSRAFRRAFEADGSISEGRSGAPGETHGGTQGGAVPEPPAAPEGTSRW